jgi:hypothetical protein
VLTKHGFYRCAVCREWFEASLVRETAVGPVCDRCRIAAIDWDASEPPGVVAEPAPLDQAKRAAGDVELPGLTP